MIISVNIVGIAFVVLLCMNATLAKTAENIGKEVLTGMLMYIVRTLSVVH